MTENSDRQFWTIFRTFLIRYCDYNREKGLVVGDEFQINYSRLLASRESIETSITKITSIDLKCDYHSVVMLIMLNDLCKWSSQNLNRGCYSGLNFSQISLTILNQSILVLNSQQQYHTLIGKQNELVCNLLLHPITMDNLEQFKLLFRRLKDVKQFYPSTVKDAQKIAFTKCIEECIQIANNTKKINIIQFIFGNIFGELELLEENHEFVNQRLKVLQKIIKNSYLFHEDIFYKVGYLLIRYSYHMLSNLHLFNYLIALYQILMQRIVEKNSIVPLVLFKHVVQNNIKKILDPSNTVLLDGRYFVLETLLSQVAFLFDSQRLLYFLGNYDWNYSETPLCQEALNLLYEYIQNRAYEKRNQFELVKIYLARIHGYIRIFLDKIEKQMAVFQFSDKKWKFYKNKKKQYIDILSQLNDHPKKILKKLQSISSEPVRQIIMKKYVRIAKKSAKLNSRSMIQIFASDNKISNRLFQLYIETVLKQCQQQNLQQFIRVFTSNFLLTGQSQQIGRVIDTITQLYYLHQNQKILKTSNATYTFANAILILNTDLHNPKNEQKISQQNFIKMCKKINEGDDLPLDIIKKTYANIKKNKINSFRDRNNMAGISVNNWLLICADYETLPLSYIEPELAQIQKDYLLYFSQNLLSSIIDKKQTAKLEGLIERFIYNDRVFQCQIIELLRANADRKPHLPLHALQKVLEIANFKSCKVDDKSLSYYWLCANIIQNFAQHLPPNLICQFLIFNWQLRVQLQDSLYLREIAEIKRIRKCIKQLTKKQSKKSFMDMFANFLSAKQSDEDKLQLQTQQKPRYSPLKNLSNNVFVILKTDTQRNKIAYQFLVTYLRNQESKLFEEFMSCLFLNFSLLLNLSWKDGQQLYLQLLGIKDSEISVRINNLQKKDIKKYTLLVNYCQFWVLKLLIRQYPHDLQPESSYFILIQKSLPYLQKIDKDILLDLLEQIKQKKHICSIIYQAFKNSIRRVLQNNTKEQSWFFDRFNEKQISQHQQSTSKTQQIQALVQKSSIDTNQSDIKFKQVQDAQKQNQQYKITQQQQSNQAIIQAQTEIKNEQNTDQQKEQHLQKINLDNISQSEQVDEQKIQNQNLQVNDELNEGSKKGEQRLEDQHKNQKVQKNEEQDRSDLKEENIPLPMIMF